MGRVLSGTYRRGGGRRGVELACGWSQKQSRQDFGEVNPLRRIHCRARSHLPPSVSIHMQLRRNNWHAGRNYNASEGSGVNICIFRCTRQSWRKFYLNEYVQCIESKDIMMTALKNGIRSDRHTTYLCPPRDLNPSPAQTPYTGGHSIKNLVPRALNLKSWWTQWWGTQ